MQGAKFKYYLRNKVGYYYYVDNLRTVQLSAAPVELKNTPDGWQKQVCGIMRSEEYKGCFTKFTSPLEFVGDGKLILDSVAIAEGPSATVELYIRIQKSTDFSYEDFFQGSHDLLNFKSKDFTTTANVNENRALAVLEAKKNVTVEIPLTDANSVQVQLDGTRLKQKVNYEPTSNFGYSNDVWTAILNEVGIDGTNGEVAIGSQNFEAIPGLMLDYTSLGKNSFIKNMGGNRVVLSVKFSGSIFARKNGTTPPGGCRILFASSRNNGFGGPVEYPIWNVGQMLAGTIYNFSFDQNITLLPGESLFLIGRQSSLNYNLFSVEFSSDCKMTVEFIARYRPTIHRAIFPGRLWRELVNKVTNGAYPGTSPFLDSDTSKLLIPASTLRSDGKNILKTTVEQFLKYAYCVHLGVLSEGGSYAEIKNYRDCFIPTDSMDVGEVADFEWGFSKDLMVGKVKGGYERQDLGQDTANGRYDIHAPVEWTTGQDAVQETYDFVCPYIGSMYAFEVMRVKYATKSTTDNPNDNSVFILDAEKGAQKLFYSGRIEGIAGNAFQLDGTIGTPPNGSTFTIEESEAYNGTYTVTNTSYLVTGSTLLYVSQALGLGIDSGWMKAYDPDIYGPKRPAYPSVTGLLDAASAFNINISPAHLLRLHGPFIYGGIYNPTATPEMGYLQFRSGERNTDLSVTMPDGRTITVNQNVPLPDLGQPVYLPIDFSFSAKYREDVFQLLKAGSNRYRQISFLKNGYRFSAYIKELSTNPDNNEPQTWVLIAAAGSNLQNLLQYE